MFNPQDRKEMRVTRDSEDPRVLWDPKEIEASKVSNKTAAVPRTLMSLVQQDFSSIF